MNTFVVREARAQTVDFGADTLIVHLEDGRSISAPLEWFPRLREASDAERKQWREVMQPIWKQYEDKIGGDLIEAAQAANAAAN